ncbi:MAG: FAD-dependent oxidoreductase [Alphaproteobacteria bacterium]|nr:FAD-dependent oxidoreductase [Alphaproteobacteria bacterium]
MADRFPDQARIVVIGGGIIGCSVAYHLAKFGCKDVVLLEKHKVTSGSTWHAAGAIGQLRANANITRLLGHSVALYGALEAETGQATGWKMNGSLRLACNADRIIEYERAATTARSFGLEMHMISGAEARRMIPAMHVADVVAAAWLPSDGVGNPSDLAIALEKGARKHGARVFEGVKVTGFKLVGGRVVGVTTTQGEIACETVVICAGIWSREIGRLAGVNVPIQPSHHQYIVTEPVPDLPRWAPAVRDPDHLTYFKEEVGGLAVGGYETNPIPYRTTPIPEDHEFKLMPENIDQFEVLMRPSVKRFPALERVGIKRWFNGIESFTEDGMFILGETPEVRNLFVGCGFNSFGIASAGGAGKALAEWMLAGEQPFDLWPADIRRFGAYHRSDAQVRVRALEGQGHHYLMGWPYEEMQAGRPFRRGPLYDRLRAKGACFGAKAGWERPNWFAPAGVEPKDVYSFGRQNWFPHVAAEHRAAREAVALFDQSFFAKFSLAGPDAESVLQTICAGDVGRAPGRITYTQMLNRNGGIECDLSVSRIAETEYYIVTGTGFALHDIAHIRRHIPADARAVLADVTSAFGCLALMGPRARDVLAAVSEGDLGNAAFPFGSWREIAIAGAPVRALRITFVGELGWELHIPTEYVAHVYDALRTAGEPVGMRDAGYRAIDSLRLEKGYRVWAGDIGPDYTPDEAGLGFAVALDKNVPFIGRDALVAARGKPLTKRLATFTVDDPDTVLLGRETIYRDDQRVGWITTAGHGHSIGKEIGLGYVRNDAGVPEDWLLTGRYELEVRTRRVPAAIHLRPLYDPKGLRVRG